MPQIRNRPASAGTTASVTSSGPGRGAQLAVQRLRAPVISTAGSSPIPTSGLGLQLDAAAISGVADGAVLPSWVDSSGSGRAVAQATTGKQPTYVAAGLNGKPVVRFAGAQFMQVASAVSTAGGYTIFSVHRINTAVVQFAVVDGSGNGVGFGIGSAGARELLLRAVADCTGNTYPTGTAEIWSGDRASSGVNTFYVGNVFEASSTGGTLDATTTITVGSWEDGAQYFLDGDIAEILIYSRQLSGTERTQVHDYLNAKWLASTGTNYTLTVDDPAGVADSTALLASQSMDDPAGLTGNQTLTVERGLTDTAGFTDPVVSAGQWSRQVDDSAGAVDAQALAPGLALTDPAGLVDGQALAVGRGVTDTLSGADTVATAASYAPAVTDPAGLVDGATTSADWRRAADDPAGVADSTASVVARQVDDQAAGTDTTTLAAAWVRTATDDAGLTDTAVAAKSGSAALTVNDPAGLTDATSTTAAWVQALSDTAGTGDTVTAGLVLARQADDPAGLVDGQGLAVGRAVNDQMPATDTAATAAAYSVTATDPAGLTDVASLAASLAVTDPAGLTDAAAAAHGYGVLVTDPAGLVDVLTLAAAWSQALTDAAGSTDTAGTAAAYTRIVDDLLGVADDLTLFAGLLDQPIRVTLAAATVTAPYRQALAVAGATSSSSVQ